MGFQSALLLDQSSFITGILLVVCAAALLVAAGSSVCILVSEEIDGETAVEAETPEKTVAETEDVRETAADD